MIRHIRINENLINKNELSEFLIRRNLFRERYPKSDKVANNRKNKLPKKTIPKDTVNCSKTIY